MGRGRAKAKQTKVARALKYFSPETDLSALQRELHGEQAREAEHEAYLEDDDESDSEGRDYESWGQGRR